MFLLYHLINQTISSKVKAVQDVIYHSDELRIYIQLSITIYLLDCLELYLDLLFKTGFYYTKKTIKADIDVARVRSSHV